MNKHRNNDDHDEGISADVAAEGAAAFSELRVAIHDSLFGLKTELKDSEECAKPVERNVNVYLAEINKLLEAGNGESSENVIQANPGNGLDLDAARAEIRSRLIKLVKE